MPRYETYIETDTRNTVNLNNLSRNSWTSEDLLSALRNDTGFRRAVRRADVVTYDVGGNDLRDARERYKDGMCGGADNQDCLRTAVSRFDSNYEAITAEILSLRSPCNTIIRTMDIYNPCVNRDVAADSWATDGGLNDFQAFKPYVEGKQPHRSDLHSQGHPIRPDLPGIQRPNWYGGSFRQRLHLHRWAPSQRQGPRDISRPVQEPGVRAAQIT